MGSVEDEQESAVVFRWQVLLVVERGKEFHGVVTGVSLESPGSEELYSVHGLETLDELKDEDAAGHCPSWLVYIVRFESGFYLGEDGVCVVYVFVREGWPFDLVEESKPWLCVAQGICGPQCCFYQVPVCVVGRKELRVEGAAVYVFQRENYGFYEE